MPLCAHPKLGRDALRDVILECAMKITMIFIAVGTPSRRGDGHADLSYVYEAAREIAAR
jgi:UDPglucose 6-dehydrogenase